MSTAIDTILTVDGIANVNFFNDRVLTAEDMRDLATADAAHRRVIGRAIGEGIATGLRASAGLGHTVDVSSGVAVNSLGELINLPVPVAVDVGSVSSSAAAETSGSVFAPCAGATSSDALVVGGAVYLLTVRPASRLEGEAPRSSLDGVGESCGPRYSTEGVQFRRVVVPVSALLAEANLTAETLTLSTGTGRSMVRSLLAHLFLGSPWLTDQLRDAFDAAPLRRAWKVMALEPCEVPIAMIGLRGAEVAFVDEFSVRRPPLRHHDDLTGHDRRGWDQLMDPTRKAVGLATVAQFEMQLTERLANGDNLTAVGDFRFLPPVGLLPVTPQVFGANPNAPTVPFFQGLAHRTVGLEMSLDQVEEALRSGSEAPPIDTALGGPTFLIFDVLGSAIAAGGQPYKLYVHDGHWLSTETDLIDIRKELAALRQEIAALDTDTPAGVRVTAPKSTTPITPGEAVPLEFSVRVNTAGTYIVSQPTITFDPPRGAKPTVLKVVGPTRFTTAGSEAHTVTVGVLWTSKKTTRVDLARFVSDSDSEFEFHVESERIRERIPTEEVFLVGAQPREEPFGIVVGRAGRESAAAAVIASVRLSVEMEGNAEISDFADASMVFSG